MDSKTTVLLCFIALLIMLVQNVEGRNKKVIIHVPYKVKNIKHTHTVFKTVHHHHKYHDHEHGSPSEEHELFRHLYYHDEPITSHSQPYGEIGIPEFLPDNLSTDHTLDIPDVPSREMRPALPSRMIPIYRRE